MKERLRAFCEGLEMNEIDKLMTGNVADFRKVGQVMTAKIKDLLAEKDRIIADRELIIDHLREDVRLIGKEVERLKAWLLRIDGGDNPCQDEKQLLRQWAYEAVSLGNECPNE